MIFKQAIDLYKRIDSYFTYMFITKKFYNFWSKHGRSDHRVSLNLEKRLSVKFSKNSSQEIKNQFKPWCINRTSSKWSGIISPPQPLEE